MSENIRSGATTSGKHPSWRSTPSPRCRPAQGSGTGHRPSRKQPGVSRNDRAGESRDRLLRAERAKKPSEPARSRWYTDIHAPRQTARPQLAGHMSEANSRWSRSGPRPDVCSRAVDARRTVVGLEPVMTESPSRRSAKSTRWHRHPSGRAETSDARSPGASATMCLGKRQGSCTDRARRVANKKQNRCRRHLGI